jgi:hypothetical protein
MSLQLRPDELLSALQRADHPTFPVFLDQLLSLCDAMGQALLEVVPNVEITQPAELWDEMLCVPVSPIDATQPIPEHLQGFDDHGWE